MPVEKEKVEDGDSHGNEMKELQPTQRPNGGYRRGVVRKGIAIRQVMIVNLMMLMIVKFVLSIVIRPCES